MDSVSACEPDLLYDYACNRDEISDFLLCGRPFLERQQRAIQIIEGIMTGHGKQDLLKYVAELARVEHGIRELEPWVRDHVVHALLSFVLGVFINERFFSANSHIPPFQWKLAGLFHDVAYPVQIAKDVLRPFANKINEIKRSLDVPVPDIRSRIDLIGLESLTNNLNSFDLIQRRLDEWELNIDARREFESMSESGEICHGMFSALALLYTLDLMYHKYNPAREYADIYAPGDNVSCNQTYFEEDIIPACAAVFVHNLPGKCFANGKIKRTKAPLAFLLRLSDCLQEWERPSLSAPTGLSADQFDIEIQSGTLVFGASVPEDRRKKIEAEIHSCLEAPDVKIVYG